jgi:hypothetical protein
MKLNERSIQYRIRRALLIAGLATIAVSILGCGAYIDETSVNDGVAYAADDVDFLAQYGSWTDIEPYGMVWQPNVMGDWEPFSFGHWVWTDAGWAWVSYEPYGWLVYHYGNWDFRADVGWFWISGNEWSPARVEWIIYGDYIGWAPLPPPGVTWADPWMHRDIGVWDIVKVRDFDRDYIGKYRIVKPPMAGAMRGHEIIHRPPDRMMIESQTRRPVPTIILQRRSANLTFREPGKRGRDGELNPGPSNTNRQTERGQTAGNDRNKGDRDLNRMVLPESEQKRVDKYRGQVRKQVLRSHPRNQGNERGKDRGAEHSRGHERGGN